MLHLSNAGPFGTVCTENGITSERQFARNYDLSRPILRRLKKGYEADWYCEDTKLELVKAFDMSLSEVEELIEEQQDWARNNGIEYDEG